MAGRCSTGTALSSNGLRQLTDDDAVIAEGRGFAYSKAETFACYGYCNRQENVLYYDGKGGLWAAAVDAKTGYRQSSAIGSGGRTGSPISAAVTAGSGGSGAAAPLQLRRVDLAHSRVLEPGADLNTDESGEGDENQNTCVTVTCVAQHPTYAFRFAI